MTDVVELTLTRLQSRLRAIAGYTYAPDYDQEDILQTMTTEIIANAQENPEFLNQKDSYILGFANIIAKRLARRSEVHDRHHIPVGDFLSADYRDDPDDTPSDCLPDSTRNPEELVIQKETEDYFVHQMRNLPPETVSVVAMLYFEVPQVEIAEGMHISPAAVNQRIATVRRRMSLNRS
jgi:DNA-directed RNA polymerase specialized sigma24 family protein